MAKKSCPTCNTYNNNYKKGVLKCSNCGGAGYRSDVFGSRTNCTQCNGAGWKRCPNCNGSGEVEG